MKKIRHIKKRAKIAVISPSNGLPAIFPWQYEKGLENLREYFDFEIIEMPSARMSPDELYRHPELRAKDINDAFADPTIDGVICSIGGYESVRILEHLDLEIILNHPKMIMGFSDATAFLSYLNYHGLVTLYGPSIMAGWAQIEHLSKKHIQHLEDIMLGAEYPYQYEAYEIWAQKYKNWTEENTAGELDEVFDNNVGFKFLQGAGRVEGALWGGCIEVLEMLKGTEFWPDLDFFKGKILFFETSEEKPLPNQVGYMLRNYGIQGVLDQISGILLGRPKDYSEEENAELEKTVKDILTIEHDLNKLPVVMNMDFGHTDPKIILPYGCKARIDCEDESVWLLESPFVE